MSFYQPEKLPKLMVAPNGARRVKKDHPAVPLTISETVETAKSCNKAGAGAIHLHVRDKNGEHVLDAGLYKEALNELEQQVPNMHIQVTTEAVGKYSPADMRKLAYDVTPPGASIGTAELIPARKPEDEDIKLYKYLTEAGTKIQHILYKPEDIELLIDLLNKAEIPINDAWCLFVIGHYTGRISYPENIPPFIEKMNEHNIKLDWSICAFGKEEISCLEKAINLGGKIRVGLENSLFMPNGEIAEDNQSKVLAVNKLFKLS
jgi:uncharacterized protein (DUF849 family)